MVTLDSYQYLTKLNNKDNVETYLNDFRNKILQRIYFHIVGKDNIDSEERCFHLSVNDCDCDVVFYCKIICEDEGKRSSYDWETETCCCLD